MTKTAKRATVAAVATTVAVFAGAAIAGRMAPSSASTMARLDLRIARLGELPGFWTRSCPARTGAAAWSRGNRADIAALRHERFVVALSEPLRRADAVADATVAILAFRSPAGAAADVARLSHAAVSTGDPTNFRVAGIDGAAGMTVRLEGRTIVRVIYASGRDVASIEIAERGHANVATLQRMAARAMQRFARAA